MEQLALAVFGQFIVWYDSRNEGLGPNQLLLKEAPRGTVGCIKLIKLECDALFLSGL